MISVVIITHNSELFIENTLRSIGSQTYENIEVLIVDDGSSDKTIEIINSLQQEFNNITLINDKKKISRSEARNYGVSKACGEFIAFCDSDDTWKENKLEKQMEAFEKNDKACLVFTGCDIIDENNLIIGSRFNIPLKATYKTLLKQNYITCSSVLVKKDIYIKFPMFGDFVGKKDLYREDFISWLSILKNSNEIIGINEPLTNYRVVTNSVSSNKIEALKQTYRTFRYFKHGPIVSIYLCFRQFINNRNKYKNIIRKRV